MKTMRRLVLIQAGLAMIGAVQAADGLHEAAVAATLKQKYPNTVIKSVAATNLPGIYEVVMGKNVAYVDETGRYFLFGHLFDMQTQTDLTEGKVGAERLAKLDFGALPIKDAITMVRGDGSRKIAVFSDPDCPYCKRLESNIAGLDNVTIHLFLFPIAQLHPQARSKSIGVWCAKDKAKAWEALVQRNEVAAGQCDHPVDRNVALAESLGINGTPTVILADGSIVPGAPAAAKLEEMISKAATRVATK